MASIDRVEQRIRELKMTINMEVKKHAMQQLQDGHWKLTLTVHPEDMPIDLLQAPMGTAYGLAMVPIDYDNPDVGKPITEKTEGEKIRERACILCKDPTFQNFITKMTWEVEDVYKEPHARSHLLKYCGIESRKELVTNKAAQEKFKELDRKYKDWLNPIEERYKDNFERT